MKDGHRHFDMGGVLGGEPHPSEKEIRHKEQVKNADEKEGGKQTASRP
ncbi:MAG: hypothetical protein K6F68_09495 [Clostridiales bacterium]|nr:hypothetical protein [Clostridiales bacterium]